jgi:hypothetical protein
MVVGEGIDESFVRVGRLGEVHPDIGHLWWPGGIP